VAWKKKVGSKSFVTGKRTSEPPKKIEKNFYFCNMEKKKKNREESFSVGKEGTKLLFLVETF